MLEGGDRLKQRRARAFEQEPCGGRSLPRADRDCRIARCLSAAAATAPMRSSRPAPVRAEIATASAPLKWRPTGTSAEDPTCSTPRRAATTRSRQECRGPRRSAGRDRSSTTSTRSATRSVSRVRLTPSAPRRRVVSRTPAVSINASDNPPMSARSVSMSRVVPGNCRDDGAVGVQQRVEQARLPHVRRADNRDLRAFADQPAPGRLRQQRSMRSITAASDARASPAPTK